MNLAARAQMVAFSSLLLILSACAREKLPPLLDPSESTIPMSERTATVKPVLRVPTFGAPNLSRMVADALIHHPDLAAAAWRIKRAGTDIRNVGADFWPTVVSSGSIGHNWRGSGNSGNTNGAAVAGAGRGTNSETNRVTESNRYQIGLAISQSLDVFGVHRAEGEAAKKRWHASKNEYSAAALILSAAIVRDYIDILALFDRIALARNSLAISQSILHLVEDQVGAGLISPLALTQQSSELARQRAALTDLELAVQQRRHALAVLAALALADLTISEKSLADLDESVWRTAALPEIVDLDQRRPDLQQLDFLRRAAYADARAAIASQYPQLDLSFSAALDSASITTLFGPASLAASLAGSVNQYLFDGGRIGANADAAIIRYHEADLALLSAINQAKREVADAIAALNARRKQIVAAAEADFQAREALRIAEVQFREGAIGFADVLDAQRNLLAQGDVLVQSRQAGFAALVDLAVAQGGGTFNPENPRRSSDGT